MLGRAISNWALIAAFLAQGMEMLDATRLGVFVRHLAADRLLLFKTWL